MKYTYTVLKLRVKQVHMIQRYNDNTKRPKPKENQLGIFQKNPVYNAGHLG